MQILYVCKNCGGLKGCWCDKPHYIAMYEFVYNAMKRLKGE